MRRQSLIWVLSLAAVTFMGCLGPEEESSPQGQEIPQGLVTVTLMTGETTQVDASKICWNTRTPIPQGHKVVADKEANRLRFVPEQESGKSAYVEEEGGGGVTCTCNSGSGGCSPAKLGDEVACVMTSCSSCTRSAN